MKIIAIQMLFINIILMNKKLNILSGNSKITEISGKIMMKIHQHLLKPDSTKIQSVPFGA